MSKRKTFMAGRLDKPLRSAEYEAAKWVRDMANDFMRERSPASSLTEAVGNWLKVTGNVGACEDCGAPMATDEDRKQHRPGGRCVFAEDSP